VLVRIFSSFLVLDRFFDLAAIAKYIVDRWIIAAGFPPSF